MDASGGFWARMLALIGGGGSDGAGAAQGSPIPIDRFDIVKPLEPAAAWAENALFKVGYPSGWHDTTSTEPTIEGAPALVVLRRTERTGKPDDVESRGVIRCFSSGRTTQGEFFAAAETLADVRARSLGGHPVEPLRFVRAGGAPCYTIQVNGKIQIAAFQTVPSTITEVHMFHEDEWLMMQLESAPLFHDKYQKALTTILGTLTWR